MMRVVTFRQFFSSQRCNESRAFEVNRRFVAGMRTVGAGFSDMETLCGILNMPPAMTYSTYAETLHDIADATHSVAQESMQNAAKELHERAQVDVDDVLDIDCMFDGSWQKRGHSSLIGYVAAISPDTRKCLDIELLSKICKGCAGKAHLEKESSEYLSWYAGHYTKCGITYGGSSPSMEPAGAVRIYERSVESLYLQYTGFVGDGDTKSYSSVVDRKPYGHSIDIVKKECVGHVQKRCGTALRKLKSESGSKRLEDQKTLGGKGRLTKLRIDQLQIYYGLAIRRNVGSVSGMKTAISAILKHTGSTDDAPNHVDCPTAEDTWCGYNKDSATYVHKNPLPKAVVKKIKPVFQRLSTDSLLNKCVDGLTQNAVESLNSVVWGKCPKEIFVGTTTVRLALDDAVAHYNDGTVSMARVLHKLGITPGQHTVKFLIAKDRKRIRQANRRSLEAQDIRQAKRQRRLACEDTQILSEGITYEAGAF